MRGIRATPPGEHSGEAISQPDNDFAALKEASPIPEEDGVDDPADQADEQNHAHTEVHFFVMPL